MQDLHDHDARSATPAVGPRPRPGGVRVTIDGVHKVFRRKGQIVRALQAVDLDVAPGEFVTLLGPSGCGKSTLLRVIGGLVDCDAGSVDVGGSPPDAARRSKMFGLVPQAPALLPWADVEHNVGFLSRIGGDRVARLSDDAVADLIDSVGLGAFRASYPHELSGGMQQRVSLVRGFALGAPVLLMDEPFAALDEITRADMRYLLLELWQRTGATVVFVTHSITEAVILSDRVVVMAARPGRIAAIESIELRRPRTPQIEDDPAFLGHVRHLRELLRDSHA
jgi:NitT/TauT family transport system ATP-binding protein